MISHTQNLSQNVDKFLSVTGGRYGYELWAVLSEH